jgi:hypothetical protein
MVKTGHYHSENRPLTLETGQYPAASTRTGVLAPFNPYWPLLNLTVAPFAITLGPE